MRVKAIFTCAFLLFFVIGAGASTYKTLLHFDGFDYGQNPFAGLVIDSAGNLYGVAAYGEVMDGTIFWLKHTGDGYQPGTLHEFDPYEYLGSEPIGGLVLDGVGNIYGTTSYFHGADYCASVFKLAPSGSYWTFSYIYYFDWTGSEGCDPEASLNYFNGRLWGTTKQGGRQGVGTVFSMDTSGGSFDSATFLGNHRGNEPSSGLNAWGYGTTHYGGKGYGVLYKLDSVKGPITKRAFSPDNKVGYYPIGDLLAVYIDGVRNMFGVTSTGGVGGGGTVYQLTETHPNSDQWRLKVLHSFSSNDAEGWAPLAGLSIDSAGSLYGTTSRGGETGSDCGTVFKLSHARVFKKFNHTVLYSFDFYNNWEDGCQPTSGVVLDAGGNLFGTTLYGGWYDDGAVYEIIP